VAGIKTGKSIELQQALKNITSIDSAGDRKYGTYRNYRRWHRWLADGI
jgi:hypothetical protein